jgi:hypothetical protein
MTPAAVHHGQAKQLHDRRANVLADAYARNPERFVHQPPMPPPHLLLFFRTESPQM